MSKVDNHGNSGYMNSGNWNSGNRNSGNMNSGNRNSGNMNSGYWNSGNRNSGNRNSGYWNSGYWNSGSFNTDCPKMRLFNKELDITVEEFYAKYNISADIPLNRWIDKEKMTKEEKQAVTGWETMGGYLKTLEYKEACKIWWNENLGEHDRFLKLPGFDWTIFTSITGIEAEKPEAMIEINGKEFSASTIQKALKQYIED